ncbi:archease [Methylotuvimicrobium sp. KM2]|uniref:archease n=1 Tax=Methylotuvimicrobium sp. KM2 TaxID=3133976 RepID=UPI003101A422
MTDIAQIPHWEHFEHKADIGIRGIAPTLEEAFEQAALAMTSVICDLDSIQEHQSIETSCQADDIEFLFLDWINELIYLMAVKGLLFKRFQVVINGNTLIATASGEPTDPARHQPAVEIKGATLTELAVRQTEDGIWLAQCVVDV